MTTATTTASTATTRLHITPFNPDILSAVLPPSVQPTATEISFHTLPTFPEKNYGYVTLPIMEAEKIKKKLHGSILKGKKFKVETARPQKEKELEPNELDSEAERSSKRKKGSKKRKAGEDVLDGHELPSDRKVKRGWTESTDAKADRRKEEKKQRKEEKKARAQAKSKYTEKEECLFRTQLPPNKASAVDEKQDKKSKKKKSSSESVVHEFANTITHPKFIRSAAEDTTTTATYEEGKGWVDDTGNVKEPVNDKIKDSQYRPGKVAGAKEKRKSKSKESTKKAKPAPKEESEESEDWTSSSGSSSDDSDLESEDESAGTSYISNKSSSDETKEEKKQSEPATIKPATPSGEDKSPGTNEQPSSKEVHPLEALYKRSAPASSETKSAETNAFSFFENNGDIESEEERTELVAPQTPFAKEDIQARGLRSAAPTPDTGLVGRSIRWDEDDDEMDVDDESSIDTPVLKNSDAEMEESDFAKWFWENRGDNNRAWKKRRREAAKEERQRENRRKGLKGKS